MFELDFRELCAVESVLRDYFYGELSEEERQSYRYRVVAEVLRRIEAIEPF